ncbi:hypothetical protein ASPWEDRAFT_168043 [Aspergillus wentii DTO 134E9]|uniref:Condensation domain-containing protein n=1 Tax=Aspergillus wentii DTO 134E9 TaxID=1073089 RepID=A0A1L9RT53_ASPWE|nr:uncharacterized protein ASPWEDRAFT_168043 [Aspergillus wentii DTO 134E9]KAI9933768.1 hypothetical protein MW887_004840 [Aspergillus wentii]OJJ38112.1 hypothetical protein ASPWEDRAFT_168043 [Aspergillus wentii DTO 134E9]
MAVQVTTLHTLQCASNTVSSIESPFHLGPLDQLVYAFVPIECVFVYRKPASHDDFIPIRRLQQALSYLLDYYPHLTDRLQFNPDSKAPEITQLGTGAELLEASCTTRLDDITSSSGRILMHSLPDSGNALTPPFHPTLEGVCRDPIFAIQHTRFACGGVALGIRLHHIVCDAHGFFLLSRHLAEIYRALRDSSSPTVTCPPVIHSYLSGPNALSSEEEKEALEYQARLSLLSYQGIPPSEAASQLSSGFWASIDVRGSSRLGLPDEYFPNAVYPPYAYSSHELLAERPLWEVTRFLHNLIRSVRPSCIEQEMKWVAAQPDKSRIRVNYSFANGSFTVSQWSKHEMYAGVDYEVDGEPGQPVCPILVSPPFTHDVD